MDKKILCIDFDGVINSYKQGWQDGTIYGEVTQGFFDWAIRAKEYFRLVVYSSRSKTLLGLEAMRMWLYGQMREFYIGRDLVSDTENPPLTMDDFEFAHEKPPAFLTIDDRAICFKGDWQHLDPAELSEFTPWTAYANTPGDEFVRDWNNTIAGVSDFARKHQMQPPTLIFHPEWLSHMRAVSGVNMAVTLIYAGIKVNFGRFEQAAVLREM